MLRLSSYRSMFVFCISITAFAIFAATGLEYVFYPEEFVTTAPGKKAIIVSAIAIPTSWGVATMIRKNVALTEELARLVNRDRLTDVATRDFFFARLAMDPNAYGVSLMVDIDHFKRVNDTFGHFAGDDVIHSVAQIMKAQIRERDIVCRFGGEEFVIFLHNATPQEGWDIAERIRSATEAAITSTDEGAVRVTVSIGGSLKDQFEHVDAAIKRADECLYRAKESGRNRTVVDWSKGQDEMHKQVA